MANDQLLPLICIIAALVLGGLSISVVGDEIARKDGLNLAGVFLVTGASLSPVQSASGAKKTVRRKVRSTDVLPGKGKGNGEE